jgi:hypothetical protein
VLAAAFVEIAAYLGIPETDVREYLDHDLPAIRDASLATARQQHPVEVFLSTLYLLLASGKVGLKGGTVGGEMIGRVDGGHAEIASRLAIPAVQDHLRREGRPELRVSEDTLVRDLVGTGKAVRLDKFRLEGSRYRGFRIPLED